VPDIDAPGGDREAAGHPRPPYRAALAVGVAAFVAYALTSPAGITWEHFGEDGAEFAAVAKVLGISHPTGYPLFTLLARLASLGAVENAWRVQLLVNAMAAGAVAVSFLVFWRLAVATGATGRMAGLSALLGALFLAASPTWWGQSVLIEVYALHLLFVALLFWIALSPDGWPRRLLLLAWVCGLALTHHRQALLVLPSLGVLAIVALRRQGSLGWRPLLAAALVAAAPLSLYLVLKVRSGFDPPLDWGNPESWSQLWWVVRGEQYRFRMFRDPIPEVAERMRVALFESLPAELGWGGLALAVVGLVFHRRRAGAAAWWAFVVFFLVQLVVYANYDIPDPDAYRIPLTFVLAAFGAAGAAALLTWGPGWRRSTGRWAVVAACVPYLVTLPATWRATSLRDDRGADIYTREVMGQLPRGALVLTDGDGRTFGLWYRRLVDERPDVALAYRLLLFWPWYFEHLATHHTDIVLPPQEGSLNDRARRLLEANFAARPTYTTQVDDWLPRSFSVAPEGRLFRVLGPRTPLEPPRPGARVEALEFAPIANACYRLDPFTAGGTDTLDAFRNLGPMAIPWNGVEFRVPRPRSMTGAWSVYTTGGAADAARLALPAAAAESSMRRVLLLVDAASGPASVPLASIRVFYGDGDADADTVEVRAFVNAWDVHAESIGTRIPEDVLAWHGPRDQSLTVLEVPLRRGQRPDALEFAPLRGGLLAGEPPALVIVAGAVEFD
jgi:hypothetical protein